MPRHTNENKSVHIEDYSRMTRLSQTAIRSRTAVVDASAEFARMLAVPDAQGERTNRGDCDLPHMRSSRSRDKQIELVDRISPPRPSSPSRILDC